MNTKTLTAGLVSALIATAICVAGCCRETADKEADKEADKSADKAPELQPSANVGTSPGTNPGTGDLSDVPPALRYPGATHLTGSFTNGYVMTQTKDPVEKVVAFYEAVTGYGQAKKSESAAMIRFTYETSPTSEIGVAVITTDSGTTINLSKRSK